MLPDYEGSVLWINRIIAVVSASAMTASQPGEKTKGCTYESKTPRRAEGGRLCRHFAHQKQTAIPSRNNLYLEEDRNQTARGTTLTKTHRRRKKKAFCAPAAQIEKSLSVIGLPFLLYLWRGRGIRWNMCTERHVSWSRTVIGYFLGQLHESIPTIKSTLSCFQPITPEGEAI